MSIQLKLLDHFRLSNHLGTNFACSISEDERFFIINDVGIYILALTGCVSNELPKFLCSKYFIHLTNFTPCGNVDLDINNFHNDLAKEDVYDLVMKLEYSANLKQTKPIEPVAVYAEWSPKGLAEGHECFLAALTNMYSLEVYMRYLTETGEVQYSIVTNITTAVIEIEKQKWSNANRFGILLKLEEYKKRINSVSPSAFTWSHLFKNNASAIFCAHINGDISVWRLSATSFKSNSRPPTFLGRYHTGLKRITTLYWHKNSEYGGALFFADIDGNLNVLHIMDLNQNTVLFDREEALLNEADKIKIDKISVMTVDSYTFILIMKQRVLIIFGVNKAGEIFDKTIEFIQEYYITGVHHFNNKILLLSLPGILTELSLEIKNNKLCLEKHIISLKNDLAEYRTHGFILSKNMVLCCILAYPWDLQSFSKIRTYVNVFVYQNTLVKPFDILWKNKTDSIENFWDCFEALRIICLKEKRFPWLGIPANLNYDTLSITKIRTLRLVAKISETVFKIIPSIKEYHIKPFILIHYLLEIKLVVERITILLKQMRKKPLTLFQMRSLFIQNIFLKEMVANNILPKANVGKSFIESVKLVMQVTNELEYPEPLICAWCGDKIFSPTCIPPHVDSRCCISMMPIFLVPDYKCPYCKSLAHRAVEEENFPIVCPYCDKIMDRIYINDPELRENCEKFQMDLLTLKHSDCFEDCLKESIEYEQIEDNDVEYTIFSDSDDESNANLKSLYEQFSNAEISDVKQEFLDVDLLAQSSIS